MSLFTSIAAFVFLLLTSDRKSSRCYYSLLISLVTKLFHTTSTIMRQNCLITSADDVALFQAVLLFMTTRHHMVFRFSIISDQDDKRGFSSSISMPN